MSDLPANYDNWRLAEPDEPDDCCLVCGRKLKGEWCPMCDADEEESADEDRETVAEVDDD